MEIQDRKIQISIATSDSKQQMQGEPVKLKMNHMIGVFGIWWIGMGCSMIVLILEILINRKKWKRNQARKIITVK